MSNHIFRRPAFDRVEAPTVTKLQSNFLWPVSQSHKRSPRSRVITPLSQQGFHHRGENQISTKGSSGLTGFVRHFEIYAEDPAALAEFYCQLFGWRIELVPGAKYWFIEAKAMPAEDFSGSVTYRPIAGARAWVNYVHVASIDDAVAEAERLGAVVLRPRTAVPKTAWYSVLADPEGNIFGIYQSDPAAHAPHGLE